MNKCMNKLTRYRDLIDAAASIDVDAFATSTTCCDLDL